MGCIGWDADQGDDQELQAGLGLGQTPHQLHQASAKIKLDTVDKEQRKHMLNTEENCRKIKSGLVPLFSGVIHLDQECIHTSLHPQV